jgi:hypothetical protein
VHARILALRDAESDPEEKRKAAPEVAVELVTRAHDGPDGAAWSGRRTRQMRTCTEFRKETGLIAEP